MPRKYYKKPKPPRVRKGRAKTVESKARSMQGSWRKATKRTETLTIAEAKAVIESPPTCIYCQQPIHWQDLSIDHKVPRSRDGENASENLVWVDWMCNQTKGDLTADEYLALITFLNDWPRMKESVLSRLRVAANLYRRKRRY